MYIALLLLTQALIQVWSPSFASGSAVPDTYMEGGSLDEGLSADRGSFNCPLYAHGKITILGNTWGGFRSFSSPFRNHQTFPPAFTGYPSIATLKPITSTHCSIFNAQSYSVEDLATIAPENEINEYSDSNEAFEEDDEEPSSGEEANEKPISIESNEGVSIATSSSTTELNEETAAPVKSQVLKPNSPHEVPVINTEIPIIVFDPIPEVPTVIFSESYTNIDYIEKDIEAPMADVEARIGELVAKIMFEDVISKAAVDLDEMESNDDDKVPIAGAVEFNGYIPASGGVTILRHF